jgi:hypothetical protein
MTSNAMSVPSNMAGGLYSHLGAIMPITKYLVLPGVVAYNVPILVCIQQGFRMLHDTQQCCHCTETVDFGHHG